MTLIPRPLSPAVSEAASAVDGAATRSCVLPLATCAGKSVTTIEGLADGGELHPVQQAWIEHQVPQCGYCQSGMILATVALLADTPRPSEAEIGARITNICRCGTYPRVLRSIRAVSGVDPTAA